MKACSVRCMAARRLPARSNRYCDHWSVRCRCCQRVHGVCNSSTKICSTTPRRVPSARCRSESHRTC